MRLRPRTREQAFRAIEALKAPGQKAWFVSALGNHAIRICTPVTYFYPPGPEITKPEQLELKEYQIIT